MSDLLKNFVDREIDDRIRDKYPHIRNPAGVYAKIVQARPADGIYEYTIRILNASMNEDGNFPEIPGVRSGVQMAEGDTAVVLLLYGGACIYVVGRMEV